MKKIWMLILIIVLSSFLTGCGREETRKIVSMSNSTQINGSFFLGCGTIEEEPVIYYYYEQNNGSKKLTYAYARRSEIYEDLKEGQTPYLLIPSDILGTFKFHVPPNSITPTFNLDVSKIK
jgi:hypothetical protein